MFNKYWIEIKYGLITLALLAGLVVLAQTKAFSVLDTTIDAFFDLMSGLGFVGFFAVAVIGNASLLMHLPYTVPLLSLALSGASLSTMLLMGVASGLGASVGEILSYGITQKIVGENSALEKSSLFRWVKHMVNTRPHLIGLFVFVYAITPLPDDTVIIPLAMARYDIKRILLPLFTGKLVHNLGIAAVFYYFTGWSADHVTTTVQAELALGLLILFVLLVAYQVEKSRLAKREEVSLVS